MVAPSPHRKLLRAFPAVVIVGFLLTLGSQGGDAQSIPDIGATETPLHWAASNGLTAIASGLIANGAKVDAPDQFGRTPLYDAVAYPRMVQLLLDAGADVNAADIFGRTPLHAAILYPDSVKLLIAAGADIGATDFMGDTPLDRSMKYGTGSRNLSVVTMLVDAGAGAPAK